MQLLSSRGCASPEFASLSVLIKGEISSGDQITSRAVGEPLLIPSPVSTIPQTNCLKALRELHLYINSVFKASRSASQSNGANAESNSSISLFNEILQEDEKLLKHMQLFRPLNANGLGLHYRVIRDKAAMVKFIPLLVSSSSKSIASKVETSIENEATGIVLCVGITGLPNAIGVSSFYHTLPNRMRDCIDLLSKTGTQDATSSQNLIATVLLTEEDDRMTNSMAEGNQKTLLSTQGDANYDHRTQKGNKGFARGKRGNQGMMASCDGDVGSDMYTNSADLARLMVERLAVLSVSETDTFFRKYEAKAAAAGERASKSSGRRRKAPRDADLDNFDFKGEKRSSLREISSSAISLDGTASIASSTSKLQLRGAKNDTRSSLARHGRGSIPMLSAPRKDAAGYRNRRSSADSTAPTRPSAFPGSGRRTSSGGNSNGHDTTTSGWSGDSNGHPSHGVTFSSDFNSKPTSSRNLHQDDDSKGSNRTPSGSLGSRLSRNKTQTNVQFDPFTGQTMGDNATRTASQEDMMFSDDVSFDPSLLQGGRSIRSMGTMGTIGSNSGDARMQVNVALNEDLTCTYKLSKMSSCSVEGVLQVQVKSNIPDQVPFCLLIRDPSRHIQSLMEDRKHVENLTATLLQEPAETRPDHKFSISIPKSDDYFPVMKYKCGTELRPVPMRVQTRVRREDEYWRVALQISSNPHNEDNLTDLTIIMGVPSVVRGETLTTSPPGGMWNASKRSVIWCVSELGGGEKFQLQARFEMDTSIPGAAEEQPKFPVLVRCQCMYAQLSDIEVEVQDISDAHPAETRMKLARRFRLSHRERP